MLRAFYEWLDKLGGANINSSGQTMVSEKSDLENSQRPYTGPERRRPEPHGVSAGDRWESNQQLKDCLLAVASAQMEGAKEKQEKAWHWGATGDIEAAAVSAARYNIGEVPMDIPLEAYRTELERRFDGLIDAYRRDDDLDPDGYGLGTLYAILRGAGWSL